MPGDALRNARRDATLRRWDWRSYVSLPTLVLYDVPEQLFREIKHFIDGSLQSGASVTNQDSLYANSKGNDNDCEHEFSEHCKTSIGLSGLGLYVEALRLLSHAYRMVTHIIGGESPRTLMTFSAAFSEFEPAKLNQGVAILSSYFTNLASVLKSPSIYRLCWKKIFQSFTTIEPARFQDLLIRSWQGLNFTLEKNLGPSHSGILYSYRIYMYWARGKQDLPAVELSLRRVLSNLSQKYDENKRKIYDTKDTLAINLHFQGDYQGCITPINEMIGC